MMKHWMLPIYVLGVMAAALQHSLHQNMTSEDWVAAAIAAVVAGCIAAGAYFDRTAAKAALVFAITLLGSVGFAADRTVADRTCMVVVDCGLDPRTHKPMLSQGTGTHIGKGLVLTCSHVVEGKTDAYLTFRDGRHVQGRVVKDDTYNDLAAIQCDGLDGQLMKVGRDDPPAGTHITIVGHPRGVFMEPRAASIRPLNGMDMQPTNLAVAPGDSGSGIFTDDGTIVGVVSCRDSKPEVEWGNGLCIKTGNMYAFLCQCYGQSCPPLPPRYVQPPVYYPPQQPAPKYVQPPALPTAPSASVADIAAIREDITALKTLIAANAGKPGPVGPAGPSGPPGKDGAAGPSGSAGVADATRLAAIEKDILELKAIRSQRIRVVPATNP